MLVFVVQHHSQRMPLWVLILEAAYSNRAVWVERGGERAAGVALKLDLWFLCVSR
jgi:hypothetical protein